MDFITKMTAHGLYSDKHGAIWNTIETAMLKHIMNVQKLKQFWGIEYAALLNLDVNRDRDRALSILATSIKKNTETQLWRTVATGDLRKYPPSYTDLVYLTVEGWDNVDFKQIASVFTSH